MKITVPLVVTASLIVWAGYWVKSIIGGLVG